MIGISNKNQIKKINLGLAQIWIILIWKSCGKDKEGQKGQVGNEWAGRVRWVRRMGMVDGKKCKKGIEDRKGKKGYEKWDQRFCKKNVNVSLQTDNGSKVGYLYAKWARKQDQKYFNFSQLAYKLTLGQMQSSNTIWAKEGFKQNKLGKWAGTQ